MSTAGRATTLPLLKSLTANGRIVNASPTCFPDLYWVLRGGGSNFCTVPSSIMRLSTTAHTCLADRDASSIRAFLLSLTPSSIGDSTQPAILKLLNSLPSLWMPPQGPKSRLQCLNTPRQSWILPYSRSTARYALSRTPPSSIPWRT
jgi:hypothetical protein